MLPALHVCRAVKFFSTLTTRTKPARFRDVWNVIKHDHTGVCMSIYSERERKADYWLGGLLNAVIKSLGEWLKLLDDWEQIVINVPAEGDPDHQQSQV